MTARRRGTGGHAASPAPAAGASRRDALCWLCLSPAAVALAARAQPATPPESPPRRLVRGEAIFSESVYLDLVTADGRSGFVARIGRFPDARVAWLWAHVFTPQSGMLAFVDDEAPDTDARAAVEGATARYAAASGEAVAGGASLEIVRTGPRLAPSEAVLAARVPLRRAGPTEDASKLAVAELRASFRPRHPVFESLGGRSELLGITEAMLRLEGAEVPLRGFGHFHEQNQEQPRFTTPFVYATLRGVRFSCIAIRSRGADRGFAVREPGAPAVALANIGIGPPGATRRLRLELADGDVLLGRLEATYRYTNTLFGVVRQASIVRGEVGGEPVTGCVNDFLEGQLEYL